MNLESSMKTFREAMLIQLNAHVWATQNHSGARAPRAM